MLLMEKVPSWAILQNAGPFKGTSWGCSEQMGKTIRLSRRKGPWELSHPCLQVQREIIS